MNLQPFTFVMQRCRPADFGWKIEFINLKKSKNLIRFLETSFLPRLRY